MIIKSRGTRANEGHLIIIYGNKDWYWESDTIASVTFATTKFTDGIYGLRLQQALHQPELEASIQNLLPTEKLQLHDPVISYGDYLLSFQTSSMEGTSDRCAS